MIRRLDIKVELLQGREKLGAAVADDRQQWMRAGLAPPIRKRRAVNLNLNLGCPAGIERFKRRRENLKPPRIGDVVLVNQSFPPPFCFGRQMLRRRGLSSGTFQSVYLLSREPPAGAVFGVESLARRYSPR